MKLTKAQAQAVTGIEVMVRNLGEGVHCPLCKKAKVPLVLISEPRVYPGYAVHKGDHPQSTRCYWSHMEASG